MSRLPRLVGLGLIAATLVALPGSPASADSEDWCSSGASTPCILSVTHDGTTVTKSDPTWQVDLWNPNPGHDVQWDLRESGLYELSSAASGRWAVTLDMGTIVPRVNYGTGREGQVARLDDEDGTYRVTISAEPTLVVSGCDHSTYPWPCTETATSQAIRLGGQVTDWFNWEDPVQRSAFYGVDFWTNIEVSSFPPGVIYNDTTGIAAMQLEFAAPHFETDGTTVHRGHFETVLPNDFLRENFFIPDPSTMTPASLVVAGGGPISTTTVRKDSASSPMEIEVTDMTFTIRKLRVRTGTVVPTRPTDLRASRVAARVGKVGYDLAQARGARVTGYLARCVSPGGDVVKARRAGNASPVRLEGLQRGTRYTCQVRAQSKVGPGPWSGKVALPRRP
jgi:hypothetical protein